MPVPRALLGVLILGALAAGVVQAADATETGVTTTAAAGAGTTPSAGGTSTARVSTSDPIEWRWARGVDTVWVKPNRTRPVDRPALLRHARIGRWINHQTLAQRLDLTDRVMTQALRGEKVELIRRREDGWSKVRLPLQRGSGFPTGIIGWVPSRQLSAHPIAAATPAIGTAHPTGRKVLRLARDYLGVRYLWGGTSAHGIDCSGLTYEVYQALGVTIPRDAADQANTGRRVRRHDLRRGDLVFFGPGGWRTVHHVGIYAGHGRVLHAPRTGSHVQVTPISAWSDYWGARRYL